MDELNKKNDKLVSMMAVTDEIEERISANEFSGNVGLISELNRLEGYVLHLPSAEPTQPNAPNTLDAISRQDAVSRFSDLLMVELRGERLPTWDEVYNAINELPSIQPRCNFPKKTQLSGKDTTSDYISRQTAIDAPEKLIIDCNPEHFLGQQKFIEFMDNAEIGSFGNWQFANGFNMGLTAAEVAIKKLPPIQPEPKKDKWIKGQDVPNRKLYYHLNNALYCSVCYEEAYWDTDYGQQLFAYCPHCGAEMEVEG